MTELLEVANKLSGVGLATLLILVLWLGVKKVWVWGYQLVECEARGAASVAAAEKRETEWKTIAQRAASLSETGLELAKQRKDP